MHNEKSDQTLLDGDYFEYENNDSIKELLSTEISRSRAMGQLIKSVSQYQPNLIYFRNSMYAFPLHKVFRIAPVVIEVASHDVFEHRELGLPYDLYNRITRGIALSRASGLVFLSRELASSLHYEKFAKPFSVIGDGVPLQDIPELPAPDHTTPVLVFVGSSGKIWHGVDKLFELARLCPNIIIQVIGYDGSGMDNPIPDNLQFLGYHSGEAYTKALANADAAISSLALHRIHIQEMSPLKTREYIAMGIPTILPYTDTDLHNTGISEILEIGNHESNIPQSAERIREFAYEMRGRRIKRSAIKNLIDSSIKEQLRLTFFKKISGPH